MEVNPTQRAESNSPIQVFVTYAWEKEHQQYVHSFVDFLRGKNFDAKMDLGISQEQTAVDFMEMMHRAINDYNKVIVFLSPKYKEKAESFADGVGNEYRMIIKDINDNPRKYIFVSTYGRGNDVVPLAFRGRDIVDVSPPLSEESEQKLYSKLLDKDQYVFRALSSETPQISPRIAEPLEVAPRLTSNDISIKDISLVDPQSRQFGSQFIWIEYDLKAHIQNVSTRPFTNITLEIHIPSPMCRAVDSTAYKNHEYREEEGMYVFNISIDKLNPSQPFSTKPIPIRISNNQVRNLLKESISVVVYADTGSPAKEFPIQGLLWKNTHGTKEKLTEEDFT